MAPIQTAVAIPSPSHLDSSQTLRATKALVKKIQSDASTTTKTAAKTSLLADADTDDASEAVPIWLILTTKKHIVDKQRLKPGKIALPHPYNVLPPADAPSAAESSPRICLITADPQRKYKDLLLSPAFPVSLSAHIPRVLGIEKLKAKFSSFESKRQLLSEYDLFLADDRVVTYLPNLLGKTFYKSGAKRPIPVSLEGKRQSVDPTTGAKRRKLSEGGTKVTKSDLTPQDLAKEIDKALGSALVHLAPSTTTSVKVGTAAMSPEHLQANTEAVVNGLVDKYVPQKWRNVRAIHLKGPETAALPVWMASELWANETEVLNDAPQAVKKRKRETLAVGDSVVSAEKDVLEVPGPDGKMRRIEKPANGATKRKGGEVEEKAEKKKKRKSSEPLDEVAKLEEEKAEKAARKAALKAQKQASRANVGGEEKVEKVAEAVAEAEGKKGKGKKQRMKAADLM